MRYFSFSNDIFSSGFKQAVEMDYASINKSCFGAKTEATKKEFKSWILDGIFLPISSDSNQYIYHHSKHANCSNVNFFPLSLLWNIQYVKIVKHMTKCEHEHFRTVFSRQ